MAEDARRRRMCEGKTRYRDEAAADRAIRNIEWAEGEQGLLRTYRCDYCGRWHLTSQVAG